MTMQKEEPGTKRKCIHTFCLLDYIKAYLKLSIWLLSKFLLSVYYTLDIELDAMDKMMHFLTSRNSLAEEDNKLHMIPQSNM